MGGCFIRMLFVTICSHENRSTASTVVEPNEIGTPPLREDMSHGDVWITPPTSPEVKVPLATQGGEMRENDKESESVSYTSIFHCLLLSL